MHHYPKMVSMAAAGLLGLASLASAQQADTPVVSQPRMQLGPVGLEPRVAVRNIGVDTNVHNQSLSPEADFTATITPELRETARIGRLDFTGASSVDWNYFQHSTSQRSFNGAQSGRADVGLGFLRPYAIGSISRSRQRPNLEIDARVERTVDELGGGAAFVLSPRLTIDAGVATETFAFGRAELDGVALADSLDRKERRHVVAGRFTLTPLTALTAGAEFRRDRFDVAHERDTDTTAWHAGLELKPLALLSGRANVGWRKFTPNDREIADFQGVIADVQLTALVREMTRVTAKIERDVEYSFERTASYYVSTGMQCELMQGLGASWDVVGRVGRTALAYQGQVESPRVDHVLIAGGGVGRRLGTNVRVGIDLDHARRQSVLIGRRYEGLRVGGSVTYGF